MTKSGMIKGIDILFEIKKSKDKLCPLLIMCVHCPLLHADCGDFKKVANKKLNQIKEILE
jgi:hypothetical protein